MGRVLITGCSTGFGRATAIELTKRGHDVVATARKPETLDDLDVAERLALDICDDASVGAALAAAGDLDALVNNAGFGQLGPVELTPLDEGRRLFETNVWGTMRVIQAVIPAMRERGGGTIVNVGSLAGRVAPPLDGFYPASKFALEAITEQLNWEVSHFGIRMRIVEPGFFETAFQGTVLRHGIDTPPYDEFQRQWEAARDRLRGDEEPPGIEMVAETIADAVESDEPKLRWPVGPPSDLVLPARASMTDEEFEAAMRATLSIDW
jgi:NAD(P)-dependent dehydrogenase (short-subunit alcohol dehydrogenase family)